MKEGAIIAFTVKIAPWNLSVVSLKMIVGCYYNFQGATFFLIFLKKVTKLVKSEKNIYQKKEPHNIYN